MLHVLNLLKIVGANTIIIEIIQQEIEQYFFEYY